MIDFVRWHERMLRLEINKPTGPFAVGQCDGCWLEELPGAAEAEAGADAPASNSTDARKKHRLMVRVYYPVEEEAAANCSPGKWLPDGHGVGSYAQAYADSLFKPGVTSALVGAAGFVPLMSNVKTNTVLEAPLVSSELVPKMPCVIYSVLHIFSVDTFNKLH